MSTLAEETLSENQARQRRVHVETIQANIAASEVRLDTLTRDIATKKRLMTELEALSAAVVALPTQIQAKRVQVGGSGLFNSTIECLRSELRSSLAGAFLVQGAKLETLITRKQAEEKRLNELRLGIQEFTK